MKFEDLLNVKVFTLGEDEYESTLKEDLAISDDLNKSLANQPQLVAMYGFAYEHALAEERKLDTQLEILEAQLDAQVRMELQAASIKYTEKMVANTVCTNQQYVKLQAKLHNAKTTAGLLNKAYQAIVQRKDAVVTMSHNDRAASKSNGSDY